MPQTPVEEEMIRASEQMSWLLAQESPLHRDILCRLLGIDEVDCEVLVSQLERAGRVVRCGDEWVAATLYEVMFGPSFEKEFRSKQVELGGEHERAS